MIRNWLKQRIARKKLARMVEEQRAKAPNYEKHRQAALKGWNTRRSQA